MVREPTRQGNILDLFLTINHTLVNSVNIIPGLSDHDIIEGVVDIKPASTGKAHRKVHLYKKADWDSLKTHMEDFCNSFVHCVTKVRPLKLSGLSSKRLSMQELASLYLPNVLDKKRLPWITHPIRREIKKRDKLYQNL